MKIFCTRCGHALEVEQAALQAVVTCSSCGNQFSAQPTPAPARRSSGASTAVIVLVVIGALAVPCIGIMAAIAIPNFIRFQARSKQGECRGNLRSVYTGARSWYAEKDAYSTLLSEVAFSPERGNRYAYFLGTEPRMSSRHAAVEVVDPMDNAVGVDVFRFPKQRAISYGDVPVLLGGVRQGVSGQCPECEFTAACVGNVDGDDTLDVWSVSTVERTGRDGERIPPGMPYNDVDDNTR